MPDLLTYVEKVKFLDDKGWEYYFTDQRGVRHFTHPIHCKMIGGMGEHYTLEGAYIYELELELDVQRYLIRDARKIMLGSNTIDKITDWMIKYEKWTKI